MVRIARARPMGEVGKGDYIALRADLELHEGALISEAALHFVVAVEDTDAGITLTLGSETGEKPFVLVDVPEDRIVYRGEYQ